LVLLSCIKFDHRIAKKSQTFRKYNILLSDNDSDNDFLKKSTLYHTVIHFKSFKGYIYAGNICDQGTVPTAVDFLRFGELILLTLHMAHLYCFKNTTKQRKQRRSSVVSELC